MTSTMHSVIQLAKIYAVQNRLPCQNAAHHVPHEFTCGDAGKLAASRDQILVMHKGRWNKTQYL